MSYTPENQELTNRLEAHIETGRDLEAAMWARIEDASEYREEHIEELGAFVKDLSNWRLRLRKLQRGR